MWVKGGSFHPHPRTLLREREKSAVSAHTELALREREKTGAIYPLLSAANTSAIATAPGSVTPSRF